MNYEKIYNDLIIRGQNRERPEGYTENHHIIPKCMGGSDDKNNLVRLTPEEHFVSHQLLVKIFPEIQGLVFACHMMCVDKDGKRINNKEFGWLKKAYSKKISAMLTGRNKKTHPYLISVGLKNSNHLKGRTKKTHTYLVDMALKLKGRTKYTHAGVAAQAEAITGRTKHTHAGVAAQADAITGRTKHTHAGVAAQAEAITGRTKHTHQHLADLSNKMTGQTKENNASVAAMVAKKTGMNKSNCQGYANMSARMVGKTNQGLLLAGKNRKGKTKKDHSGIAKQAEKLRKFPEFLYDELYNMKQNKISNKDILVHFKNMGIDIGYSSISSLYSRIKKEREKANESS